MNVISEDSAKKVPKSPSWPQNIILATSDFSVMLNGKPYRFPHTTVEDIQLIHQGDLHKVNSRNGQFLELAKLGKERQILARHWQILLSFAPQLEFIRYLLAKLWRQNGDYQQSEALIQDGLRQRPTSSLFLYEMAFHDFFRGRYSQAWQNFRYLWLNQSTVHPLIPLLKAGLPLLTKPLPLPQSEQGKTILINQDGGMGDLFHTMRYLKLYQLAGYRLKLVTLPQYYKPLKRFIETLYPGLTLINWQDIQQHSADGAIGSWMLPQIGHSSPDDLLPPDRLKIDDLIVQHWQAWLDKHGLLSPTRLRLGISLGGSADNHNDPLRSISLEAMHLALGDIADLIVLNYPLSQADKNYCDQHPDILNPFSEENLDVVELAALIELCDLVVGVDSFPIHLAGNQYKEVWVMLYDPPEFRWGEDGVDYAWYPTMRLYRQQGRGITGLGNWSQVLTQIRKHLGEREFWRPQQLPGLYEIGSFANRLLAKQQWSHVFGLFFDIIIKVEHAQARQKREGDQNVQPALSYMAQWLMLQLSIVAGAANRKDLSLIWLDKLKQDGMLAHSAALWRLEIFWEQDKTEEAVQEILSLAEAIPSPQDNLNHTQAHRLFQNIMAHPDFFPDKPLLALLQSILRRWLREPEPVRGESSP